MIRINYSHEPPKIRTTAQKKEIFCVVRRKWFLLTPEEWVRQNFIHHVITDFNFPSSLIAVEKQLQLGDLKKRFDIVMYNRSMEPFMLVECKEMNVPLTPDVLNQVLRYNIPLRAPYIIITNGTGCIGFRIVAGKVDELDTLPLPVKLEQ